MTQVRRAIGKLKWVFAMLVVAAASGCGGDVTAQDSGSDAAADDRRPPNILFYILDDGERTIPEVGLGIHCDGRTANVGMLPPRLGADTEDVLSEELMLSQEEIAALRKDGTI